MSKAFVSMLDHAREFEKRERGLLNEINHSPELQSMLYDLNLLPEQNEIGSERWEIMLAFAKLWQLKINILGGTPIGVIATEHKNMLETLHKIKNATAPSYNSSTGHEKAYGLAVAAIAEVNAKSMKKGEV